MKTIEKINGSAIQDGDEFLEALETKINELVDRVNEIILKISPSAHPQKENKGYENEPFENKITDPNDR